MRNTKIINLYGGPGVGKSSTAYCLAGHLKWRGLSCELSTEYAKDLVWQNSLEVLDDQVYVFGKQYHKLFRLKGKVDLIITDSPLLLSLFYGKEKPPYFEKFVLSAFKMFDNYNFILKREKKYVEEGRVQNEKEAKLIDFQIKTLLTKNEIPFNEILGNEDAYKKIMEIIEI